MIMRIIKGEEMVDKRSKKLFKVIEKNVKCNGFTKDIVTYVVSKAFEYVARDHPSADIIIRLDNPMECRLQMLCDFEDTSCRVDPETFCK
jgi:hypothetical protein